LFDGDVGGRQLCCVVNSLVTRPDPEMKFTTPLGKQSRKTSIVGMCAARTKHQRRVTTRAVETR
jgi:hypothetical protein